MVNLFWEQLAKVGKSWRTGAEKWQLFGRLRQPHDLTVFATLCPWLWVCRQAQTSVQAGNCQSLKSRPTVCYLGGLCYDAIHQTQPQR